MKVRELIEFLKSFLNDGRNPSVILVVKGEVSEGVQSVVFEDSYETVVIFG